MRYRSLNSDRFVKQKLEPPPPPSGNNSKFNCFLVKLPLLFNFHIRHLDCRKLKEKKYLKKEIFNCAELIKKMKCNTLLPFVFIYTIL